MWGNGSGRVFVALGATDMRRSINGLSAQVEAEMDANLFSGDLFVFSNRSRTIVKILYWERNGFCLWQKKLERDRFRWPKDEQDVLEIKAEHLKWLLDGLDIKNAHKRLEYNILT